MTDAVTTAQRISARYWALLALTAALFASAFFLNKVAVASLPPLTVAAGRVALAAAVALAILRLTGGGLPTPGRDWQPLLVVGLLTTAVPFTGIAWGQRYIDSGLAGIIYGTIPIFTVLFAHFLTSDERFTARRGTGVAVGLAGIVLIFGPAALAGVGDSLLGSGLTLMAATSHALGATYVRRCRHLSPIVLSAGQLVCGALVLVPLSLIVDAPWQLQPAGTALAAIVAVAVVGTAVPLLITFWLIQRIGATNTSLLAFLMPVMAIGFGAVLLGEWLPWEAFAGLVLILAGAAAVGGRPPRAPDN